MLQTSSFNQTHVLVASNSISLSCLEGRIYIINRAAVVCAGHVLPSLYFFNRAAVGGAVLDLPVVFFRFVGELNQTSARPDIESRNL